MGDAAAAAASESQAVYTGEVGSRPVPAVVSSHYCLSHPCPGSVAPRVTDFDLRLLRAIMQLTRRSLCLLCSLSQRKNGRMEGYGTYRFPSGTVYTGEFLDGEFHGEGTLQFADCGKYHAKWEHGKAVKGRYVFADGLAYTEPTDGDWAYCREDGDRRFYSELVEGLRPAGDSQLANAHPPPSIPKGTYDVGDGYLDDDGKVYPYNQPGVTREETPKAIRTVDHDEEVWAKAKCREG